MTFRVSTDPTGHQLWWCAHETIPGTHTSIRPATPAEAAVMARIANATGTPPLALGKRIQGMLNPQRSVETSKAPRQAGRPKDAR